MNALVFASLGEHPIAFVVILSGIAALLGGIHLMGRWAAATHPAAPTQPAAVILPTATPSPLEVRALGEAGVPGEVMAAVAAAVAVVCGSQARILRIDAAPDAPKKVSVEALMLQWSIEGRRQIYSSHRVR